MCFVWQNQSLPSSAGAELKLLTASLAAKAVPRLLLRNRMLLGFASLTSHGTDLQPSPVGQFLALRAGDCAARPWGWWGLRPEPALKKTCTRVLLPGIRAPTARAALLSLAADQHPDMKTRGWASFLVFCGSLLLALSLARQIKPINPLSPGGQRRAPAASSCCGGSCPCWKLCSQLLAASVSPSLKAIFFLGMLL